MARTDAERRRQQANSDAEHLVSDAQATAKEIVSKASVDTAGILALEQDERTFQSRDSLLLREYRARIANITGTGRVTLVDPKSGVRVVLPGNPGNQENQSPGNQLPGNQLPRNQGKQP
jgi:regulator of protease activity HflC (stomatin/prohibitin superfamily)